MLDIHRTESVPDTKIYFSHSVLPSYIDPQNASTKKKPFSTFHKQPFNHSLDLILPEEIWELVRLGLERNDALSQPQYARVHMKLSELLEPEFLDSYIKQGNIMMLSEGRPLIDNCFSLHEGKLKLELDRPTYERCGLQGTPIEDGGKKHQKQRWVVEYDLRSPSMKHGKKGFSRLEWACSNVLNQSLTWLFHNFNASSREALAEGREVLSRHAPWIREFEQNVTRMQDVLVPRLTTADLPRLYAEEDDALGLIEYIHMLGLNSPRVYMADDIDAHLSRYEVPDFGDNVVTRHLVKVSWKGFISEAFVRSLFLMVRERGLKGKNRLNGSQDVDMVGSGTQEGHGMEERWFGMSAQAFGGKSGWTVMQFSGRETLVWEVEG